MTAAPARVSPAWLALREAADAQARSSDLVDRLRADLPPTERTIVHDLACGSGAMGRWLAPRLAGAQHWILYDRDPDLLAAAMADPPGAAADGATITVETRQRDVTRLEAGELAGADLVTASALLDMLTADELDQFVAACAGARCPVLVTLSVIGRVELTPADPLDERIADAFNAHQRRAVGGRRLLGPDAADAAADAFTRRGAEVLVRSSPWRLTTAHTALTVEWLTGWIGAACEAQPELADAAARYALRRRWQAAAGRLRVTVGHHDLLIRPR